MELFNFVNKTRKFKLTSFLIAFVMMSSLVLSSLTPVSAHISRASKSSIEIMLGKETRAAALGDNYWLDISDADVWNSLVDKTGEWGKNDHNTAAAKVGQIESITSGIIKFKQNYDVKTAVYHKHSAAAGCVTECNIRISFKDYFNFTTNDSCYSCKQKMKGMEFWCPTHKGTWNIAGCDNSQCSKYRTVDVICGQSSLTCNKVTGVTIDKWDMINHTRTAIIDINMTDLWYTGAAPGTKSAPLVLKKRADAAEVFVGLNNTAPAFGDTVTANISATDNVTWKYTFYVDGVSQGRQDSATFKIDKVDYVGKQIHVVAKTAGANDRYKGSTESAKTNAVTASINTGWTVEPSIIGVAQGGQMLTYNPEARWNDVALNLGTDINVSWHEDSEFGAQIGVGDSVVLPASSVGKKVYMVVTGASSFTGSFSVASASVSKTTPTLEAPTAENIEYGQTLADSALTGGRAINPNDGSEVAGTWTWGNPDSAPKVATTTFSAKFTPDDTEIYNKASISVPITITKSTPNVTEPVASEVVYGQTLLASSFEGGVATNAHNGKIIEGTWRWIDPAVIPSVGMSTYQAAFVPNDIDSYNEASIGVRVTASKIAPLIIAPTAGGIEYGQTLASSSLIGGSVKNPYNNEEVPGTWAWLNANTTPKIGITLYSVTFTPDDMEKYNIATIDIHVTTSKATPVFVAPTASEIEYGQALADSALTGGSGTNPFSDENVEGTWAWTNSTIKPNVGEVAYSVTFTPNDIDNYNAITTSVNITISKSIPKFTTPTASGIEYGQALSSSIITNGAVENPHDNREVEGVWTWMDSGITPEVGTAFFTAVFTPNDADSYDMVSTDVSVSTLKTTPAFAAPTASEIEYGQKLESSILTGGIVTNPHNNEAVDGVWTWADSNISPNVGTEAFSAHFTPNNETSCNVITVEVSVSTGRATPNLTAPTAASIIYGQALADSELANGVAINLHNNETVEGTWKWADIAVKPDAGESAHNVKFTPNDAEKFNMATIYVNINTIKASPEFEAPTATDIGYGQTLASSVLVGGSVTNPHNNEVVEGVWAWVDSNISPNVGTALFNVMFTPNDTANYNTITTEVSVSTGRTTPEFIAPTASGVEYGQTLANSSLIGGAVTNPSNGEAVEGVWVWEDSAIHPNVGTESHIVIFTPQDTLSYDAITTSVSVHTSKATLIFAAPTATEIEYGQTLANSSLENSVVKAPFSDEVVEGTWAWVNPSVSPHVGTESHEVLFTPNDTVNFNVILTNVDITIGKATPKLTAPTAGDIVYGQTLADSPLTGGSATNPHNGEEIEGTWQWTNSGIKPNAGEEIYRAKFAAEHVKNYNLSEEVHVNLLTLKRQFIAPDKNKITTVAEDVAGANNGQIHFNLPLQPTLEYRLFGSEEYHEVTDNLIIGLSPGKYEIRYAENENESAGLPIIVTVLRADETEIDNDNTGSNKPEGGEGSNGDGTLTQTPPPTPAPNPGTNASIFVDIKGHWAAEAINEMAGAGIVNGYSVGNDRFEFLPNKSINRAEFVKLLAIMSGDIGGMAGTSVYPDVKGNDWFAPYVVWGHKNAIIKGYEDGEFRPQSTISRQEMALMLQRYVNHKNIALTANKVNAFTDEHTIPQWSYNAIKEMQKLGIINGDNQGKANPFGDAKRSEAVKMLHNLYKQQGTSR